MKEKLSLALILLLLTSIICIPTIAVDKQYKIAVLPFDDGSIKDRWWGHNWEVGKGVSDELVTALLATRKFRLIEREQIDKILKEQNFGVSGRVDSSSAARIGKILGVQLLVMGRVTEFSLSSLGGNFGFGGKGLDLGVKTTTARVVIDARLVDTTTAEIKASIPGKGEKKSTNLTVRKDWDSIAFGSNDFQKTNLGIALRDAVNQVASGLAAESYGDAQTGSTTLTLTGTVFYVKDRKVIINIGAGDGVQPGMVFKIFHIVDVVKDPDTGEVVDEITEPVAEIIVVEVKEKTSTCNILKGSSQSRVSIKDKVKQK